MPEEPELKWISDTVPRSVAFDDTYFSRTDGRAETRYVFIDGNGLFDRWGKRAAFRIGELGFGTGLNFFESARHFQVQFAGPDHKLSYVSFERYPLNATQMAKALERWPDTAAFAENWLADWCAEPGVNHINRGNVSLSLVIGDANSNLPQWADHADAWYLDGFNPKNNEAMWGPELMAQVYQHTRSGGTFATYTAAGWVRRNLAAAGFEVRRRKGFGNKREMLTGLRTPA